MSMTLRQRLANLVLRLRFLHDKLWLLAHVWRCVPGIQANYLQGQLAGRKKAHVHTTARYSCRMHPGLHITATTYITHLRPVPGSPKAEARSMWEAAERCVQTIEAWRRSTGVDAVAQEGPGHQG